MKTLEWTTKPAFTGRNAVLYEATHLGTVWRIEQDYHFDNWHLYAGHLDPLHVGAYSTLEQAKHAAQTFALAGE